MTRKCEILGRIDNAMCLLHMYLENESQWDFMRAILDLVAVRDYLTEDMSDLEQSEWRHREIRLLEDSSKERKALSVIGHICRKEFREGRQSELLEEILDLCESTRP